MKGKGKDLIFVYHSFGSYAALTFFYLFPYVKLKGIIDLGGAPIRFYKLLNDTISSATEKDINLIFEEKEKVHEEYSKQNLKWKKEGIKILPFQNKYQTIIFFKYIKEKWFRIMFENNRNLQKVLKLICYGSKDTLFEEDLLSEKAVYYCYKNRLEGQYEKQLIQKYERVFGQKVKNIQERFIFNF